MSVHCVFVFVQVQFGHAGSCANADAETALAKNKALKDAGAVVPCSFDELGDAIRSVSNKKKSCGGFAFCALKPSCTTSKAQV